MENLVLVIIIGLLSAWSYYTGRSHGYDMCKSDVLKLIENQKQAGAPGHYQSKPIIENCRYVNESLHTRSLGQRNRNRYYN